MTKLKWNYLIDAVLYTLMTAVILTGLLQAFVLAEGPVAHAETKYFWGLHRHQWGDIHLYLSLGLCAFIVLHLVLHWSWILASTRKFLKSSWTLLAILVLPLALLLLAWSLSEQNSPDYAGYGSGGGRRSRGRIAGPPVEDNPGQPAGGSAGADEQQPAPPPADEPAPRSAPRKVVVRGSMTLAEVEQQTGVAAQEIARRLELPGKANLNQNLGRLRKTYAFEMERLREVVTDLSGGRIVAIDGDEAGSTPAARPREPRAGEPRADEPRMGKRGGSSSRRLGRQPISGQLSLQDVQRQTGISARAIAERVGLPADAPLDEQLGLLRKRYGFRMQDIRDSVEALRRKTPGSSTEAGH